MKKIIERARAWLSGQSGMTLYLTALIVAVAVVLNAIIYALTNHYGLYLYAPDRDTDPLSGMTEVYFMRAIEEKREVTITFCQTKEQLEVHDTGAFVLSTALALEEKHKELINIRYVNYITGYDQDGVFVDLSEYKTNKDGGADNHIDIDSVIFECEGNYKVITDVVSEVGYIDFFTIDSSGSIYAYNGEELLTSMILWVLNPTHKTVYFTENHSESADVVFSRTLSCAGYLVKTINLKQSEIPDDAAMLVISAPTSDFQRGAGARTEIERIRTYIEKGGDVYVCIDPYAPHLPNLEGLLTEYGITVSGGYTEDGVFLRDIVRDNSDAITTDGYGFVARYAESTLSKSVRSLLNTYSSGRILLHEAAALSLSGTAQPMLLSSESAVTVSGGEVSDDSGEYTVAAYNQIFNEHGNDSNIYVIACPYMTTAEPMVTNGYANKDFIYSVLNVMYGSSAFPMGCKTVLYTRTVLENFTMGRARLYTAIIMAIPAALAVCGAVVIIRRKNR